MSDDVAQVGQPRRRGRPARSAAGAEPAARDRILTAARSEFAERGYDKASIRGIAKGAGVDPALVHHYFGTKEQVFAAAIELAFGPTFQVPELIPAGPPEQQGERLARFFFGVWENPVQREPLLAIVRSAVGNEAAAAVFRDLISSKLMVRIAAELNVPDPQLRSELAAAQLVGIALLRYVIKMKPLADVDPEYVIALVSPGVQRLLTGDAPAGDAPAGGTPGHASS
ncbi:TetR/AcrR family transcriptional regulator [Streptomyces zagrosensis]|uniref:AcrR family transcriptional regulator n=1 Tax=Streptomyces zagrosensis TaxID=1042984 RepID=A0A7W9QFS4_9ACTN|nr:TetR family transcriptional regulator [Streptomyces zagrosensis]MBB5939443.1 AcrR family transcriptional regulator [Streptomyces zagrosensis]